jgi:hypothetical protein
VIRAAEERATHRRDARNRRNQRPLPTKAMRIESDSIPKRPLFAPELNPVFIEWV